MSYDSTIIGDGVTVFWPLDDNISGNPDSVVDSSGNGHTGTLQSASGYTSRQASLLSADPSAFSMAVGNLVVEVASIPGPAAGTSGTGDFALEGWGKTTSTAQIVLIAITGNGHSASIQLVAGVAYFFSPTSTINGGSGLDDGNPHHFFAARRSGQFTIYVDGTLVAGPFAETTDFGSTVTVDGGALNFGTAMWTSGGLQKFAYYDNTTASGMALSHYNAGTSAGAAATITEQNLPSNHNGNITVHAVGTSTTWSSSTTWTPSGVSGWTVSSKTFVDTTHYTIVLAPPAAATPPAGSTGTLTLTEGVTGTTAATTTVGTPTLAISPTSGQVGTTPTLALTGANTLWASETPAGLFTTTGGTGTSIGTPSGITNTGASDVLTVGSATGVLNVVDSSTGAKSNDFTASNNATAAITDAAIVPSGLSTPGYAIDRAAMFPKAANAGWDFAFNGSTLKAGLAQLTTGTSTLQVVIDNGSPLTPSLPAVSSSAWPAATTLWTGSDGAHQATVRIMGSGPGNVGIDATTAFTASGATPSFSPPTNNGPREYFNSPAFRKYGIVSGAWGISFDDQFTGTESATLYAFLRVGQQVRRRGVASKVRIRGRYGSCDISPIVDGVAGAAFRATGTDYDWIDLIASTADPAGIHEYGLVLDSGTLGLVELQFCGASAAFDNSVIPDPRRGKLIVYGDSLSTGTGVGEQEGLIGAQDSGNGWAFRVAQATNRDLLNLARPGATVLADPIKSRNGYTTDAVGSHLAYLPPGWDSTRDVIVWLLGFADLKDIYDGTSPSLTALTNQLSADLTTLANTGAGTVLACDTIDNLDGTVAPLLATWAGVVSATVTTLRGNGLTNLTYVPMSGVINTSTMLQDGVHPNLLGENAMVAKFTGGSPALVPAWTVPQSHPVRFRIGSK